MSLTKQELFEKFDEAYDYDSLAQFVAELLGFDDEYELSGEGDQNETIEGFKIEYEPAYAPMGRTASFVSVTHLETNEKKAFEDYGEDDGQTYENF